MHALKPEKTIVTVFSAVTRDPSNRASSFFVRTQAKFQV